MDGFHVRPQIKLTSKEKYTMRSMLYWHPYTYKFLIRLFYKKHYGERYETINDLIAENSSVVDVCCGDSYLQSFFENKNIEYLGLDFNPTFINFSSKRGINAKLFNIYRMTSLKQIILSYKQVCTNLFQTMIRFCKNYIRQQINI